MGTPEERATILHCVFRDFCRPPPTIGWALSALRRGSNVLAGDATAGSNNDNKDDNNKGGGEEEVD
jgi:hypothetical protein